MAKKGEDVCWNCTGVTFYNEELRKLGKRPKCYGVEYKATVPIPPDKMEALNKVPKLPANTKVFLIGHSQASAKMHQQGQTPVLRYGMEISMVTAESPTNNRSTENSIDKKHPSRNIMNGNNFPFSPPTSATDKTKTLQPPTSSRQNDNKNDDADRVLILPQSHTNNINLFDISQRAWTSYKRSSLKLLFTMDKLWKHSTTNLPDRFSRSFMKLGGSCQRSFRILVHRMQVATGFEGDGKRKPPQN